jgi:Flp pilus assembly protein TadD
MLATLSGIQHLNERRRVTAPKENTVAMMPFKSIIGITIVAISCSQAWAGDVLKITIPRRSELTPVQRLNREGVELVKKRQYEKAAALFYKAYLYDPADPFTLNNLGYISELQGELARAQKFYALASEQGSNANIDRSNAKQLEGKPMQTAFQSLQDVPMRVNRMNVNALNLLSKDSGSQAVSLLRATLLLDPQNPFTLNNLGVAYETTGDYDNAMKYYNAAASSNSSEPVVLTLDRSWRGKQVSTMAAASARRLNQRMRKMGGAEADSALFTMRGVFAANQNDWLVAKQNFLHAYSLDPTSAFSLNNRGYVAEMDGDLETAQFFYDKARKADNSDARVGLATQRNAEGKKLFAVATDSDRQVDGQLDRYSQQRHLETGPIELTPRGNGNPSAAPEKPSSPGVQYAPAQPVPQPQ